MKLTAARTFHVCAMGKGRHARTWENHDATYSGGAILLLVSCG